MKAVNKKKVVWEAHQCWAAGHAFESACLTHLKHLSEIALFTQQATAQLATQADLTTTLLAFANNQT
jgi:hypothetical protein